MAVVAVSGLRSNFINFETLKTVKAEGICQHSTIIHSLSFVDYYLFSVLALPGFAYNLEVL